MDSIDDIKFAVNNNDGFIIALFHSRIDAETFKDTQPKGYEVITRNEDFYIDFDTTVSTSFDIR